MKLLFASLFVSSLTALPVSAQSFRAENNIRVQQGAGTDFFTAERGSATNIWCAAGDYALRVLGAGQSTRIIVATQKGQVMGRPVSL